MKGKHNTSQNSTAQQSKAELGTNSTALAQDSRSEVHDTIEQSDSNTILSLCAEWVGGQGLGNVFCDLEDSTQILAFWLSSHVCGLYYTHLLVTKLILRYLNLYSQSRTECTRREYREYAQHFQNLETPSHQKQSKHTSSRLGPGLSP